VVRRGATGEIGVADQMKAPGSAVALALIASCWSVGCVTRDYMFSVVGRVHDASGRPVVGARVTLRTQGPVYQATTLVRDVSVPTGEGGGFVIMYITHKRGTPYLLSVENAGCQSQEVRGAAPPNQDHLIALDCSGLSTDAQR
jgi:Carboxypeptidase regulatory-like domain